MKIAFDSRVISWHVGSGLCSYTANLLKWIAEISRPDEYKLLCPDNETLHCTKLNATNSSTIEGCRYKDFWSRVYNTKWDCNQDYDLFHNTINGIGLPDNIHGKLIITVHDLIPYILPETVDNEHLKYVLKYTPYIMERAAGIITVSENSKNDIKRYFDIPDEKLQVTYLAADPIYRPLNREKAKMFLFDTYGINNRYILYLGGFSERKNIERLIVSFSMSSKNLKEEILLLILGEPSRSYSRLIKIAEKYSISDRVRFMNFIPKSHLPIFYNCAEVFVYPSIYEGFGLPPLEAMQCGTPVITSAVSSIPEVVDTSCILVNPYDIEKMSQSIYESITDESLKAKYSQLGLRRAKEFSWEKTAKSTIDFYMRINAK